MKFARLIAAASLALAAVPAMANTISSDACAPGERDFMAAIGRKLPGVVGGEQIAGGVEGVRHAISMAWTAAPASLQWPWPPPALAKAVLGPWLVLLPLGVPVGAPLGRLKRAATGVGA